MIFLCGRSSSGRAPPCQGGGSEFEPRRPLQTKPPVETKVSTGGFVVCGTGRQPIQQDKTANDNYYLLTLAAIAKEIKQRGLPPECSVRLAAGLPLTSFGRDKPRFRDYLFRTRQPVHYRYSRIEVKRGYEIKLVLDANYRQFLDGKIDYGVGYLIEKTDIRHRKVAGQMKKMTA